MTADTDRPELTRLTVNLTPKAVTAMNAVAEREHESKTDAVNRAIQVYDFISEQQALGKRVLLSDIDGSIELVRIL